MAAGPDKTALTVLRQVGDAARFAAEAAPYLRKDIAMAERAARELEVGTGLLGTIVRSGPFVLTQPEN